MTRTLLLVRRFLTPAVALAALLCMGAKHANWVEVRSPNFIVISNGGEKQARKTALQFEEIREVFRQSLQVASSHPSPLITVIAAKDDDTMKQLLPEDYVKNHVHHAGMFVYGMNLYFALVELGQDSNSFETFYHEYYHSLTVPYFPGLPLWVAEGLAEFYGHTQIEDKSVGMGRADLNLVSELENERLIPLDVLFKIDRSSPYYNEDHKTSIFYAESWALIHYLMLGDRSVHRAALVAYLKALDQGKSQEEAGTEAFGDLKKLQANLGYYVHSNAFYYMRMPFVSKVGDSDLKAQPISEAEAEAYEGGFEVIRQRPQDGKALLDEALAADPKLPQAYEYMAISDYIAGDHAGALTQVSKAVDLDPNDALTRFLRAQLVTMTDGFASAPDQVEDDARKSIALNPNFAPPYGLLAVYMASHDENLSEALSFAQKAISFEPASSNYQLALAQVLARMNKFDEAKMAALRAQAWAQHPQERDMAKAFLSYLQQASQYQGAVAATTAEETTDAAEEAGVDASVVDTARGTVTADQCHGGLMIDLTTDTGVLHLRGTPKNNFSIVIEGRAPVPFSPCSSLRGMQASIQYSPDQGKSDSGVIRSLDVFVPYHEPALPPGTAVADGTVAGVVCKGNEMRLTLTLSSGKPLVLHATDYTKLTYLAGANSSMGDMDPCSQFRGRAMKITYRIVAGKAFAGEMQTVVVGK